MYRKLKWILVLILFSESINASNSYSCVDMVNIFNRADYKETIVGQKGYEKQIKKYSIKEKEFLFWKILDNTNNVKFRFINNRCNQLYFILKEKNLSVKAKKLFTFKKRIFSEYQKKLKKQKKIIKTIDGCQKFASKYFRSFINMNRNNFKSSSVSKRQYKKCIKIKLRKRKK